MAGPVSVQEVSELPSGASGRTCRGVSQEQIAKGAEQMCREPIRVLRVVPGGGVDAWLLKVARQIDRERIKLDFCALWPLLGGLDDDVRALGGRVLPCLFSHNLATFPLRFGRIPRAERYDVVHCRTGWPADYSKIGTRPWPGRTLLKSERVATAQ